ncbi:DUF4129 domain-containing protein [Georgenia wutianyii]|uniref:DUF4129 domain-containing protein n=1 Tax=Georgenia wutianyii TaxID=2585135 RepID=A0ABX5VMC7_9MICO|nr:DUF4129 domain-containing protein [Georgenia wutianyii]QDB78503.1 DUF4129 domain-containing protein [Georgenia wutianyii]
MSRARLLGVPVEPDAEEARRWAQEELSRSVYRDEPGVLDRLWRWLGEQLQRLLEIDASAPESLVPVIVVVGAVVLLVLALYLAGPVRRRRRTAGARSHTLFDDEGDATSASLTAAADDAADRGDWALAVLMRFRAIIRSLDERTVLDDRPGLTAHEAGAAAASLLPGCAAGLTWAARLFDDVCYGSARPGPDQDARMRELAREVAAARPVATGRPVGLVAP